MSSCTIIISHYDSLNFLRATIRQIRKFSNPNVQQKIIIADQSNNQAHKLVVDEFGDSEDIRVVKIDPKYSGYGIDFIMNFINIHTDYVCQIHVDAMPISSQWLYLPIKLIEEFNLSFVGQLQFISDGTPSIYPPNPFFAMAQCFNVAKTETYKEMSLEAGFTRYHERATIDVPISFKNDDWAMWARHDYSKRGSDDDVVAFHWQDVHRPSDKLGLAISGFIGSHFGRIIDDLVFHFGSCRESIPVIDTMGEQYKEFTRRINENYDDALIDEMVTLAKTNRPPQLEILTRNFWNGKTKKSYPPTDELNNRIEELKNGME